MRKDFHLPDQPNDRTLLQRGFRVYEFLQGDEPRIGAPQDSVAISLQQLISKNSSREARGREKGIPWNNSTSSQGLPDVILDLVMCTIWTNGFLHV